MPIMISPDGREYPASDKEAQQLNRTAGYHYKAADPEPQPEPKPFADIELSDLD